MSENVIELKNISKHFTQGENKTIALDGIDLEIKDGEFVAIVGPSGSGKSTLMHILGLLDSPTSGEYHLNGQSVIKKKDGQLAKLRRGEIGFVFQSFNLLPRLSVEQNIILPMIYARVTSKERRSRAAQVLKLVGLTDRAKYRVNQISGGETQRVAVARALVNNPSLILADEPTGNLDTKNSGAIIGLLSRLHRHGSTIVIVTHNPEIAEQAERVITMRDGHVLNIRRGTQQTSLSRPRHVT